MSETTLDLRGLKCPLPVLKIQKAMKTLETGEILVAEATDPLSVIDVPNYCNESGNRLIEQANKGDVHEFRIEKTESVD